MATPVEQLEFIAERFEIALKDATKYKKPTTETGGVKASVKLTEVPTVEQITEIRRIGRKSINAFSSEEIEKTQYWAKMFWGQLKEKSPFFRAWFGDWREYDAKEIETLGTVQLLEYDNRQDAEEYIKDGIKNRSLFRGDVKNADTGFVVNVGTQVYNDTLTYSNRRYLRNKNFDEYIVRLSILQNVEKIIQNSVLLDSIVSDSNKNPYQSFMHKFYTIAEVEEKYYIVKLTVDELNSSDEPIRRAYNVNSIKISPVAGNQVYKPAFTMDDVGDSISTISISKLFDIVKKYDNEFTPNPVNPAFLNDDGTPKVYYHGANATFTVFDRSQSQKKVHLDVMGAGNYFTDRYQGAERFGDNVIEAYIKVEKPYIFRNTEFNVVADQIANDFGIERNGLKGNVVQQFLKEKGYDGVLVLENGKAVTVNAFDSEQIKSATDNIGTFDGTKKDIRYSYAMHKGKGYDGKSMSVNAREAYDNGEMPISKWTKKLIIEAIEEYAFENDIDLTDINKLNISELSHYFLEYSSWHHTGALYKPTGFYKLNYEAVKSFDKYKIEEIISTRKKTEKNNEQLLEEKINQEALKMAKNTHKMLTIIYANDNHNIKQFSTFIKRFISGNVDIEKEYAQAIKQLSEKEMQSIAQWKQLTANHWRHASVNELETNPIKYFENKYLDNTNSNSKEIQQLKRYFVNELENMQNVSESIVIKEAEQYDKKDIVNIDGMPLADYNSRGWAYGLLNAEDLKLFYEKVSESMRPGSKVVTKKLADGTYVFEVNNKILLVSGTFKNPVIEHIVLFNAANNTELKILIDVLGGIPYGNNTINGLRGWFEGYKALLGEEYLAQYRRNDYCAFSEREKGTIKRATLPDGFASFGYTEKSNERRRSSENDNGEISGNKYSRQIINSTWEDIRTKMSENGVHEDIINEVDNHINHLRSVNLTREEAMTEGLIPKYNAILKVAREYTKGSDVNPHRLANTINELMWAANDGNLDTKQFVSTVKLISEDILRTGKKLNDDMYREYAEFRAMTRAETVYVEESVYNQYVEEYGSVKNLNSATQGKIRIKPYKAGEHSGRALDDFYGELQEAFPALFREEADVYHQLYEILKNVPKISYMSR